MPDLAPVEYQPEFDHALVPVDNDPFSDDRAAAISIRPVADAPPPAADLSPDVTDPNAGPVPDPNDPNYGSSHSLILDRLLGLGGQERYQTWPEKMVRSAIDAPHAAMTSETPVTSEQMIEPAQSMAGLAGTGGVAGTGEGGLALGAGPIRPTAAAAPIADAAPKFYSNLENTVTAGPNKATGSQWLGTLQNKGVKKEELETTGTQDFLTQNADKPLTKDEVAKHVAANKVELGEKTYGAPPPFEQLSGPQQDHIIESYRERYGETPTPDEMREWYDGMKEGKTIFDQPNTRYEGYQLPGGENYREKLLTLPEGGPVIDRMKEIQKRLHDITNLPAAEHARQGPALTAEFDTLRTEQRALKDQIPDTYKSSHWDEPNVLVHRRTNEREVSGTPTPEQTAAIEQRSALQPQIDKNRAQQGDIAKQIRETVRPLESARRQQIFNDVHDGKIPNADAMRALEEPFDHPEIKPLQDKLQELRATEDRLTKSIPPEPKIGKPSMHIEEIQSDWHQQGRQKGYADPEGQKRLSAMVQYSHDNLFNHLLEQGVPDRASRNMREQFVSAARAGNQGDIKLLAEQAGRIFGPEAGQLADTYGHALLNTKRAASSIPDAPFKKNWHELALKDAIREAAEKGFDRISWTPGEAQAARYDLSKQVDELLYKKNPDGTFQVSAQARGRGHMLGDKLTADQLSDHVGKDVAEKIAGGHGDTKNLGGNSSSTPPDNWKSLSGLDFKVGGEGMKGFYDKMIPDAMNKIGKPHGVKVEKGAIPDGSRVMQAGPGDWRVVGSDGKGLRKANGEPLSFQSQAQAKANIQGAPVHYMDIPASLKDQALKKGFPLFADSPIGAPLSAEENRKQGYSLVPVEHNPFSENQ